MKHKYSAALSIYVGGPEGNRPRLSTRQLAEVWPPPRGSVC